MYTICERHLPSGKHTKNYGTSPFCSWVNQRFLWAMAFWCFLIPWASGKTALHCWWLSPTPLKNDGMSSSVGMMTFPIWWKSHKKWKVIKFMFQTTNQIDTVGQWQLTQRYSTDSQLRWSCLLSGIQWCLSVASFISYTHAVLVCALHRVCNAVSRHKQRWQSEIPWRNTSNSCPVCFSIYLAKLMH